MVATVMILIWVQSRH